MSGKESNEELPLPPLIAHLIESAKAAGESRYAALLGQFGRQAVAYVPSHQILNLPDAFRIDDNTHKRLKEIAAQHLGLADLERRFQGVLDDNASQPGSDRVITALNDMLAVRDTANVLWGLSLGLALAEHAAGGRR